MSVPVAIPVNAFWHGPPLAAFSAACLQSFVRRGRRVRLFMYDRTLAPAMEGVEVINANEVMPEGKIIAYRREGSYALGANRFRLEMMRQQLGLYVDCDLYCLKDIDDSAEYVMGRQGRFINNGVLKLPAASPIVSDLLALFEDGARFPDWFRGRRRVLAEVRRAIGLSTTVRDWPWGTTGPAGFTHLAHAYGLDHLASPESRFYALPPQAAVDLAKAGYDLAAYVQPDTETIHLWNERIRRLPPEAIEAGSPLWRLTRGEDLL
jgi:hypothetical protein